MLSCRRRRRRQQRENLLFALGPSFTYILLSV